MKTPISAGFSDLLTNEHALTLGIMTYAPLPLPILIIAIISFLVYSYKHSNSRQRVAVNPTSGPSSEEKANFDAMKVVTEKYRDYTAEVFDISVFGRKKVETFRLLKPGREVELRRYGGSVAKVFAYGEYIADLFYLNDSNLERIFNEKIPFHAYLGGRDMTFLYDDDFDSCSIIVFYKLDGIPPTKVNLI